MHINSKAKNIPKSEQVLGSCITWLPKRDLKLYCLDTTHRLLNKRIHRELLTCS